MIEDEELTLTEKYDPDNCKSSLIVTINQGCEEIIIDISGMSSDTREWSGHSLSLDKERIEILYNFLSDHLNNLKGMLK